MLTYNFEYKTLEQIADEITETFENGPTFGFEKHTAEYIAAAYAVQAQFEQGNEICEDSADVHFDVLEEAGARFDRSEALDLALQQSENVKQALAE
ncbi:hypothetical protein ACWU37_16460 [Photobacterium damselae subsp. damselae]